jgi:hypothetical protein
MTSPINKKSSKKNAPALTAAEKVLVAELVADGLNIQDKFNPKALYNQTGEGRFESGTVEEIRQAKQQAKREKKK